MKINSKILEIQFLAMVLSERGYHCFTRYAGHVNMFEINLYEGEWEVGSTPISQEFEVNDSKPSLDKVNRIIYKLKYILRKGGINYEQLVQQRRVEYYYTF